MVGMAEVEFSIQVCGTRGVKKVGNERKWVSVFFHDLIQTMEIDAKSEFTSLLLDEEYQSSMGRACRRNETIANIIVNEFAESFEFGFREGIDRTKWR